MCGIWGAISKGSNFNNVDTDKILPNLLIAGNLRGTDGAGMFSIHKDFSTKVTKKAGNSFHLFFSKEFTEHQKEIWKDGIAFFGHNRAATRGDIKDKNTHPFETKDIILIHNGTVTSGLQEYEKEHDVDSAALAHMIEERGMLEVSKSVSMAYALIWYDKRDKSINFCRNHERPLSIIETAQTYFFASEPAMLYWILERNSEKIINEVTVNPLFQYKLNLETQELSIEKLKTRVHYNYNNNYNYNSYLPTTTPPKKEETLDTLRTLCNKDVTFKITQKLKVMNKSQPASYEYFGTLLNSDIRIKFTSRKELPDDYQKETYKGVALGPEKTGLTLYLLIKAKTVTKANKDAAPELVDDDGTTILDLGDGNSMSLATFKKKTTHGCLMCYTKLHENQAQYYTESPDGEGLLCDRCSAEFLTDIKSFKERYLAKKYAH